MHALARLIGEALPDLNKNQHWDFKCSLILTKCWDQGDFLILTIKIKSQGKSGFSSTFLDAFLQKTQGINEEDPDSPWLLSLKSRKVQQISIFPDFKLKVRKFQDFPRLSPISLKKLLIRIALPDLDKISGSKKFSHPNPISTRPDPICVRIVSPSRYLAQCCKNEAEHMEHVVSLVYNHFN